jgi:hypothetical protein
MHSEITVFFSLIPKQHISIPFLCANILLKLQYLDLVLSIAAIAGVRVQRAGERAGG